MRRLYRASRVARGFTSGFVSRTSSSASSTVNLQDARPFEEIPGPGGRYNIPGIGAMFHFKPFTKFTPDDMPQVYDGLLTKYGPLVRVKLPGWTVLIEDPEDMETVIRNEGKYPNRQQMLLHTYFHQDKNKPEAIGNMQGEEWHQARVPLNSLMMRTNSAQHYLEIQNGVADDLVTLLQKPRAAAELRNLFYRYACESISAVSFNKRLGFLNPDGRTEAEQQGILEDIAAVNEAIAASFKVLPFMLKYFNLPFKKNYYNSALRIMNYTDKYYEDAIREVKGQQTLGSEDKENFMTTLMTSGKVSPENMSGIAFALFVAGTDSTARTLQMVLYNLAKNPDKQDKLYQEVHSILGDSGPLTEQAVSSMPYLHACARESYRMIYPIVNGSQRYLPSDLVLKGYRIPKGTSIVMMNQKVIKDPKYFPDPESFTPERWLRDENRKRPNEIPAAAVRPFGFGKRMCLGKRFAEQEIYLAVSKILQKYKVSVDPETKLEIAYSPFAGPKTPFNFVFTKRD